MTQTNNERRKWIISTVAAVWIASLGGAWTISEKVNGSTVASRVEQLQKKVDEHDVEIGKVARDQAVLGSTVFTLTMTVKELNDNVKDLTAVVNRLEAKL